MKKYRGDYKVGDKIIVTFRNNNKSLSGFRVITNINSSYVWVSDGLRIFARYSRYEISIKQYYPEPKPECTAHLQMFGTQNLSKYFIPSENNTMNKLRETIRDTFFSSKIKKIAKLVEELEASEFENEDMHTTIMLLEQAIDSKNKRAVETQTEKLKKRHKVVMSAEAAVLLNSQQAMEDLISATFKD